MELRLYHYWRSSCSWRVRMAFAFKQVPVEYVHVNLLSGEQNSADHVKRNPCGLVPSLQVTEGGSSQFLAESVAIIEWLEETFTQNSLLPKDKFERARVRQLVQVINADTQPIQNLRVMNAVSQDQAERVAWSRMWTEKGLAAYETLVKTTAGIFSFGDSVTMADLFLVPQVYNAGRFNVDLAPFPTVQKIYSNVLKQKFCQDVTPDKFEPKP